MEAGKLTRAEYKVYLALLMSEKNIRARARSMALRYDEHADLCKYAAFLEIVLEETQGILEETSRRVAHGDQNFLKWKSLFNCLDPDIRRGQKVLKGAQKAAKQTLGNEAVRKLRYIEFQTRVNEKHSANPSLSHSAIAKKLASELKVSYKTITRNTNLEKLH